MSEVLACCKPRFVSNLLNLWNFVFTDFYPSHNEIWVSVNCIEHKQGFNSEATVPVWSISPYHHVVERSFVCSLARDT